MERKKSNLLYAMLGGIITCFVCVGMVFTFTSNGKNNLKSSNKVLQNPMVNVGDILNNDEEVSLGDTCVAWSYSSQGTVTFGTYGCTSTPSACADSVPTATATSADTVYTGCTPASVGSNGMCTWKGTKYVKSCSHSVPDATTAPTTDPTTAPTTNTCNISGCTSYASRTNTNCKCSACLTGLELSADGKSCIRKTYTTCVNECTAAGGNISDCEDRCTSAGVTPTPTATPKTCSQYSVSECPSNCYNDGSSCTNPTPTPVVHYCYKFENNACTSVVMDTCDTTQNYYVSWTACRANIQCGTNQYIYGNLCSTCPSGKQVTKKGCQGNEDTCCVSTAGACYCNPINSRCEWRNTNANDWIKQPNISTSEQCNSYSTDYSTGCFKNSSNKYVWGSYGDKTGYSMVSGVTGADSCEALNSGDPEGKTYGLSCPSNIVMIGQTIACTFSTSTDATLTGAASSGAAATAKASGKYVNVTGVKEGSVTVYGTTSDGNKTNSVALIVSDGSIPDKCTVSISSGSTATSIGGDDLNSYYTVNVVIYGKDCGGQTVTYSATNSKNKPPKGSYTMLAGKTSHTESFKVYPENACKASTTTATLTNGNSSKVTVSNIKTDWKSTSTGICEKNPSYTSFEAADRAGANVYYTNYGRCADGSSGYTVKWTRGGCGGGSTQKIPYCYIDDDGAYHWTVDPQSSWKKVDNITKEADCKKDESPACYKDPDGALIWGKYATSDGYTLITSVIDEASCKSEEEFACYRNKQDNYVWAKEAPKECSQENECWVPKINTATTCQYDTQDKCEAAEGYKVVEGIVDPEKCAPEEAPACFIHGNSFVWGKYDNITGYIKLEDVTSEADCKAPENDACYEDKDGNYVWGKYSDQEGYKLIPSVTDISQCNNDVPTPSTGIDVSKLIYVFMAILMACGIGFIYYSSVMKKEN